MIDDLLRWGLALWRANHEGSRMVKGRERRDGDGRSCLGGRLERECATNKQTSRNEQMR